MVGTTLVTLNSELADLRQQSTKTIMNYYTRTLDLMQKYNATDRTPGSVLTLVD